MKIPENKTVYIGKGRYKGEIPDNKVSDGLKKILEKQDKPKKEDKSGK